MSAIEFWCGAIMVTALFLALAWTLANSRGLERRRFGDFSRYRPAPRAHAWDIAFGVIALTLVFGGGFLAMKDHESFAPLLWLAGCLMILARIALHSSRSRKCRCGTRMDAFLDDRVPEPAGRVFFVCHSCETFQFGVRFGDGEA